MLRRAGDKDHDVVIDLGAGPGNEFASTYPSLWAFLSASAYDDGESRQTGTMLLFVEQGKVKACLNDRECSDVSFVTGGDVLTLLQRVEEGLRLGDLDWRAVRGRSRDSKRN